MGRKIGTVSMGVRAPIIKQGDPLADIVTDAIVDLTKEGIVLHDRDVVAITEAVVARSQGNYATIEQIAADVSKKFGNHTVGVIFPILSRNRFSVCLKGIAKGLKKMVLMLSYPSDEVGNHLIDLDALDQAKVNPWSDVLSANSFCKPTTNNFKLYIPCFNLRYSFTYKNKKNFKRKWCESRLWS